MKSAIIGLGVIGKVHYAVLKKQGADIAALVDVNPVCLDGYDETKYSDYRIMLDEVKPDVVHICTPHYLHAEMIISSLSSGANVLVEKPLCIKREDIDKILSAEKNAKGILGVCYQNRYNASSVFVKKYLENKRISFAKGTLEWHRDENYYRSAEWRGKKDTEGGGVLINQAIHTIDLMQWICGEATSLKCDISNRSLQGVIEVEDTAGAEFYGKTRYSLFATTAGEHDNPVEIKFETENEEITLYPDKVLIDGKAVDVEKNGDWYGKEIYGSGHEKLIADFYDCVGRGEKFSIDGEEGAKSVRAVLTAYESDGKETPIA